MVVDYIPLGFDKVDEFFRDTGYTDGISQEEILLDLTDNRFCTYLYRNGKKAGLICGRKSKVVIANNCCRQHLKDLLPDLYKKYKEKNNKTYYIKKDINNIYYCNSNSVRMQQCGRKVKRLGELCYAHKYKNTVNLNKMISIFLKLTIFIFIVYIIFIYISIMNICKKQKQKKNICFGSLEFDAKIYNNKNVFPLTYNKKKIKRNFLLSQPLSQPLTFSNGLILNDKYNYIKFGDIDFNFNIKKKLNNKRILLKIKTLIFFKKLYLNIKNKKINNNIIYEEPQIYFNENTNEQSSQTRKTSSYLFDDINYMKKLYTSLDFIIKSFENKHGPPPNDTKRIINYILDLFKYPDFNILKIDDINNDIYILKKELKNNIIEKTYYKNLYNNMLIKYNLFCKQ
jgi:hypothetical protein